MWRLLTVHRMSEYKSYFSCYLSYVYGVNALAAFIRHTGRAFFFVNSINGTYLSEFELNAVYVFSVSDLCSR